MRAAALLLSLLASSAAAQTANETRALRFIEAGYALLNAGDLDGARATFIKARDLVPDKANPYRWLGIVEARLGRCADALISFDEFPPKSPGQLVWWLTPKLLRKLA